MINIRSHLRSLIFSIKKLSCFFDLTYKVKKELFNGLAEWIIDKEPNYPSFGKCKLWIKKQNPQYIISKNDENKTIQYYSQSLFLSMFAFIPAAIAASSTIYFFPMWIMFGAAISVIFISKSIAQ